LHETAGHKSRLWIFDQVSSGAAEREQETNAPINRGSALFTVDSVNLAVTAVKPDKLGVVYTNWDDPKIVQPGYRLVPE
jgi:hypothetical protein